MKVNAIKVKINTRHGHFGYFVKFQDGLNIVRGSNSSGKSTLVLSLLYGLGLEELSGGRNDATLPYALKDYFIYDGKRIDVLASEVFIEIENKYADTVTLRRSIKSSSRNTKLVEVITGSVLTVPQPPTNSHFTYLHDAGAAGKEEGFHAFLERFLGLNLPLVPSTNGGEVKLYLQALFAALAVEQKRGWTDYVANIPYFGIRDPRIRVVEFLLHLDVFQSNAKKSRLDTESVAIATEWQNLRQSITQKQAELGILVEGLPVKADVAFDGTRVHVLKSNGETSIPLREYLSRLDEQYLDLKKSIEAPVSYLQADPQAKLRAAQAEAIRLANLVEVSTADLSIKKVSIAEYEDLLQEVRRDLERNKGARKLRTLGAESFGLYTAKNQCPTCHQSIADSLLQFRDMHPQMDLDTNIVYLEKQERMLSRQLAGISSSIRESEAQLTQLDARLRQARSTVTSIRGDLNLGANESRALIREQIAIELEHNSLTLAEQAIEELVEKFAKIANRLKLNQAARKELPKSYYSDEDSRKIRAFEKQFRANAASFGYESADIDSVQINDDALLPFLSNLELREILEKTSLTEKKSNTSLRNDSSASDFVRLIWSYLLALYQASNAPEGGAIHPGFLLFDEPGQHSMGQLSQRALLLSLSSARGLQSIVAASFDESDSVFKEVTQGVRFNLYEITDRSILPMLSEE